MNNNPLVERNKDILKDLLRLDPIKYKNFDNVAKFVLEAPINEENKSVTLHIMSKIFVALHESNKNWELGRNNNAAKIAEMSDIYTQTNLHIAAIIRLIKIKFDTKINLDLYNALLNIIEYYIKNPKTINLEKDYQGEILDTFSIFFSTYPFKTSKRKELIINQLKTDLEFIKNSFSKVMNYRKNQMIRSLVSTYNKKAGSDEYNKALRVIYNHCCTITFRQPFLSSAIDRSAYLEKMSKELSDNFQVIGLHLPKSLLCLSLIGISEYEKNNSPKFDTNSKTKKFYINNLRFLYEGNYLQKDFFYDFSNLINDLYANNLSSSDLAQRLNDNNDSLARMSIILRKASAYIITNEFRYVYTNVYKQLGFSKELFAESLGYEYVNSEIEIYLEMFDNDIVDNMNQQIIQSINN